MKTDYKRLKRFCMHYLQIRVNSVLPGLVDTPHGSQYPPEIVKMVLQRYPRGQRASKFLATLLIFPSSVFIIYHTSCMLFARALMNTQIIRLWIIRMVG